MQLSQVQITWNHHSTPVLRLDVAQVNAELKGATGTEPVLANHQLRLDVAVQREMGPNVVRTMGPNGLDILIRVRNG